jgi:MYXO-CTERM domain-containing protein
MATPTASRARARAFILALAASVACPACVAATDDGADRAPSATTAQAITEADDDAADPAVVALLVRGQVFCTGVLIAKNVVATAAHCVSPSPPDQVFFGAKPSSKRGTFIAVSDHRAHPDFDEDTLANDIAVVGLATRAPVPPLPVLTEALDASWVGRPLRLVGFGAPASGAENDLHKRSGATTIERLGAADFVFRPGPSQTCNGDSGGPAFATVGDREVVVGLASSGDASCRTYGRHVRVDTYAAFLATYAEAYSTHRTAAPMPNSGCAAAPGPAPASPPPTTGLGALLLLAAARRRRRSLCAAAAR